MTITGAVTDDLGRAVSQAQVLIANLRLSTTTGEDGTYQLFVPALRVDEGTTAQLTARRIGLRAQTVTVALASGLSLTQDFVLESDPFLLEEVVVTGQGLREQRAKLGATINSIRAEEIRESEETNLVAALAGKAPNVEVTSSTGDPGGGVYFRIRGAKTIFGGTEPLIVVDGVVVTNASNTIEASIWGTGYANRLIDLNPDDVESIEILKGAAASGLYGSRATNGVVIITTKSGRRNSTQVTLKASLGFEEVTRLPALQSRWARGVADPAGDPTDPANNLSPTASVSWGPMLSPDSPVFDHANEMFGTGVRSDNSLTLSGGSDRTTYFLSLGYLYHDGTIDGNANYKRLTARLKGAHDILPNLNVAGNFAFTTSDGDLVQQGSNLSGMLLGAFRTPPEFNNLPYLDPVTGLHRSYRNPDPTELAETRGYDNPHWVANEIPTTANVDRYTWNLQLDWDPWSWFEVRYLVGLDFANDQRRSLFPKSTSDFPDGFANDQRRSLFPKSTSDFPDGRLIRAELVNRVFDHTLLGAFTHAFSEDFAASLTLGQNLNQTSFRRFQVDAYDLIHGAEQLDFAVDRDPLEFEETVQTEGYFADLALDLWGQLFVKTGVRYDGSNTFGGDIDPLTGRQEPSRFWYPKVSVAWDFGRYLGLLDFGKLRAAYGQAGRQPPAFSNILGYEPVGTYFNYSLIASPEQSPNTAIAPERTAETEAGLDLALLGNRLNLGVTYYRQQTTNAIVGRALDPATGFLNILDNAAEWHSWGWEISLDLLAFQSRDFDWRIKTHWGTNRSVVDSVLGSEELAIVGFSSFRSAVVPGYQLPVLFGRDFYRFGRGATVGGVNIDSAFSGWQEGDLYIDATGFPVEDPDRRVIGDPNPDWTGSLRSTFTFFNKLRLSGLLDVKHGGDMLNGTKGALYYFGTHADTDPFHGSGVDSVFATCTTCGPGAGTEVTLNWQTWFVFGDGNSFTGPSSQFVEDAGFVKLRDLSLSYTWDADWLHRIGFNTLDITLSGRNLVTWTSYTGIDPESNLTGQTLGRGLEYFNHPQARTFVFTLTFNR
jgi:TonB-linked SusC/RagA family outer membrane protein